MPQHTPFGMLYWDESYRLGEEEEMLKCIKRKKKAGRKDDKLVPVDDYIDLDNFHFTIPDGCRRRLKAQSIDQHAKKLEAVKVGTVVSNIMKVKLSQLSTVIRNLTKSDTLMNNMMRRSRILRMILKKQSFVLYPSLTLGRKI